jgi:cell division septation protein DedD
MESRSSKKFPAEILITLWVIGSVFFFSPAYAGEHKWVLLGEMDGNLWFVDTGSISCAENICRTWVKIISRTSVKKISIEKEEYTKSLYAYNCTWREYQIVQTTRYDAQDNVISSTASTETGRKHMVPEPISNALYDIVCKKTGQQNEQQDTEKKYYGKGIEEPQKSIAGTDKAERTEEVIKQPGAIVSPLQAPPSVPKKIAPPVTTEKAGKVRQKKSARLQKRPETMFTVQVGAFQKLSYATSLKTMLGKKGYKAHVTTSESKEGKLYKVSIGKFSDKKEAKTRCEEIKKTEGIQAFVSSW